MLSIIYGSDADKKREARDALIKNITKNDKNFEVVIRTADTATPGDLEVLAGSTSLFGEHFIVVLDGVFENVEIYEWIILHVELFSKSKNYFLIIESELTKEKLTSFKKHTEQIEVFDLPKGKSERFNLFALTDAFGMRDKKRAWEIYRSALSAGLVPQEIIGVLMWNVKTMLLVARATREGEPMQSLGLNPFVLRKTQGFIKKYTEDELAACSRALLKIYHDDLYDGDRFEANLEAFILGI